MSDTKSLEKTGASAFSESAVEPAGPEEYVRWAYRLLLGREPENEESIRNNIFKNDRRRLVEEILGSEEFFSKQKQLSLSSKPYPYEYWNREATALIHMPKTGGSTLDSLLREHFGSRRTCGVSTAALHLYSPAEIAEYDFFTGHFDYFSVRFIPRQRVRSVSIFRDPQQRLISWYRFKRSHPATEFADDIFAKLANELSAEEFFENGVVVRSTFINNSYLFFLGSSLNDPATLKLLADTDSASNTSARGNPFTAGKLLAEDQIVAPILEQALQRIKGLHAIGITERFQESIEYIFAALELPVPDSTVPVKVTDELPKFDTRFKRVPPVEKTERLTRALQRLTRYDQVIYNEAKKEFERRRNSFSATDPVQSIAAFPASRKQDDLH